ncbi:BTB domain-containing protein [Mycena venus]|uniref:BTB domain-containing protein n=1 Tax=Mycena venus TaxID=2733690 RepID=A0A8H6YBQ4_9AGAR|nr:BTB domain-containing protein [Mycena venus]
MVAFTQPSGGVIEKVDRFPAVRLHDLAADVEVFLRAIYDSRYEFLTPAVHVSMAINCRSYFIPAPAPIEILAVLGILRLSHKYDIEYLYRRALEHLKVDEWYGQTYDVPAADHILDLDLQATPALTSLSIIHAAMEVGAQWLLPRAYCWAATLPIEELLLFHGGEMEPYVQKCLRARETFL